MNYIFFILFFEIIQKNFCSLTLVPSLNRGHPWLKPKGRIGKAITGSMEEPKIVKISGGKQPMHELILTQHILGIG